MGGTVSVNCVEVVVGVLLVVVLVVKAFLKVFAPEERSIKLSLWCMHLRGNRQRTEKVLQ